MNPTFQQKLQAIFQFAATQVLPVVVTDLGTQTKILPYVGLAYTGISLLELLFTHNMVPAPAPVPTSATPVAVEVVK